MNKFVRNFIKSLFISTFCIMMLFTLNVLADSNDKARDTANNELKKYSKSLKWSDYNFSSQEEFDNATVGQGLPVYRFDMTKLANGTSNLQDAMYDTNTIEYTVNSNGKSITRFTLAKQGDSYVKNKIGGNGEALSKGFNQLSTDEFKNSRIVKLGPATFLYTKNNNNEKLVYIDDVPLDNITPFKPYNTDKIIPLLQQLSKSMVDSTSVGGVGTVPSNNSNFYKIVFPIATLLILMATVMLTHSYLKKRHN